MTVIVRDGVPVNPAIPVYYETLVTCVQCRAEYYIEQGDPGWTFTNHPLLGPFVSGGSCPQCGWVPITIYGNGSVDQTIRNPLDNPGGASNQYAWSTTYGLVGVYYLQSIQEGIVAAIGMGASGAALPSKQHPTDANYLWSIRRPAPGAAVAVDQEFYALLPSRRLSAFDAGNLDAGLVFFIAREGIAVLS